MKKTILNSLFGIIALIIAGCVSPPRATAQPVRVEDGVIVYPTNFWSANATAHLNALIALGVKTNAASASASGWLSSADWSTFNSKQTALGYTPATNSLAGLLAAMGYTPPTNNNSGIVLALGFNPATNTLAGIAAALGYTPPTNTFAGLTNALGYIPATNTVTGILAALGYTPPTNSFAGITNSLKYFPATNSLSGIAAALGYTPPPNTFAGITTALTYTPATNSFTGITSALTYTPATNSLAGILAALGYTPQNGSATLTNLAVTGAITNGLAPGSGISFTTNSGVISIAVTAGGGGSGAADSINPNAQLNGTWTPVSGTNYLVGTSTNVNGNLNVIDPAQAWFNSTGAALNRGLYLQYNLFGSRATFQNDVTAGAFVGSGASLTGIPEGALQLSDNSTGDASTVKHGFMPKLSGGYNEFLNGNGAWVDPHAGDGYQSTQIGINADAGGTNATALGGGAQADDDEGVAVGYLAWAKKPGSVSIGQGLSFGTNSVQIGHGAFAIADGAIAIGGDAAATLGSQNSIVIGNAAGSGGYSNSIAIGAGVENTTNNQVIIGTADQEVLIPGFSGSGTGDVTADGNNAFTGDNTHSGTETFSGTVTLPSESVGTNNAVQAEWNDFIDARITTGTDSPTNFLGAPGSGSTGASFNASALTNASPKIATNNATASDGWVLSKSGDNLKLVAQSAGAGGFAGTTNSYWVQATGMVGDGTTDNTAALQALIDAYLDGPNTNESVNVTIFVPPGRYRFSAAPKGFLTNENAMIGIPRKASYTTVGIPLWSRFELRGNAKFQYGSGTASSGPFPTNGIGGTIFFIDRTNRASFIASQGWETNTLTQWNYTSVSFQNILFLKPDDSQMSILNLKAFPSRFVQNCTFGRLYDGSGLTSASQPVAGTAIISPGESDSDLNRVDDVNIFGFYNGMTTCEHDRGDNINIQGCVNGLVIEKGIFMTHYDHVYIGNCQTNIIAVAPAKIKIDNLELERNAANDWRSNRVDYVDKNSVSGEIRWMCLDDINSSLSQKLRIGTGSARGGIIFRSNQYGGRSQTEVTSISAGYRGDYMMGFSDDPLSPSYSLFKGRGNTGSGSIVQNGDYLGMYMFGGFDGSTYPGIVSAFVDAMVDGSPSAGSIPTRVEVRAGSNSSAPVIQTWQQSGTTFQTNAIFAAAAIFTNAPTFRMTNAAPTSVTIGTTPPDWWVTITNNAGEQGFMPVWKNH